MSHSVWVCSPCRCVSVSLCARHGSSPPSAVWVCDSGWTRARMVWRQHDITSRFHSRADPLQRRQRYRKNSKKSPTEICCLSLALITISSFSPPPLRIFVLLPSKMSSKSGDILTGPLKSCLCTCVCVCVLAGVGSDIRPVGTLCVTLGLTSAWPRMDPRLQTNSRPACLPL